MLTPVLMTTGGTGIGGAGTGGASTGFGTTGGTGIGGAGTGGTATGAGATGGTGLGGAGTGGSATGIGTTGGTGIGGAGTGGSATGTGATGGTGIGGAGTGGSATGTGATGGTGIGGAGVGGNATGVAVIGGVGVGGPGTGGSATGTGTTGGTGIGGAGTGGPAGGSSANTSGLHIFVSDLFPVNNSGADGVAVIVQNGANLLVDLHAVGVTASASHPSQIEASPAGLTDATLPSVLSGNSTIPLEGQTLLNLVANQAAPVASSTGHLSYDQVMNTGSPLTLPGQEVAIHGLTVGNSYEPSQPAAIGLLHEVTASLI